MKVVLRSLLNFVLAAAILALLNAFGWVHLKTLTLSGPSVTVGLIGLGVLMSLGYMVVCLVSLYLRESSGMLVLLLRGAITFGYAINRAEPPDDLLDNPFRKRVSLHLVTAFLAGFLSFGVAWLLGAVAFSSFQVAVGAIVVMMFAEVIPSVIIKDTMEQLG